MKIYDEKALTIYICTYIDLKGIVNKLFANTPRYLNAKKSLHLKYQLTFQC